MKALLREPLLHFLVLGAAVFAAYGLVSKGGREEPGRLVVTKGQVESMVVGFTRTWQRPPKPEELEGLIRDRVREEVYYREAMALGLDKDDTIIRRRLRQKLEFLTDDLVVQAPADRRRARRVSDGASGQVSCPSEGSRSATSISTPTRHGNRLERDAAELLALLNQAGGKADVSALGDPFLLDHNFATVAGSEVANLFGGQFARKLGDV